MKIIRKSDNSIIYNTENYPIIYTDRYIFFGTSLENEYLYGLGERAYDFKLVPGEEGKFSFFNKD